MKDETVVNSFETCKEFFLLNESTIHQLLLITMDGLSDLDQKYLMLIPRRTNVLKLHNSIPSVIMPRNPHVAGLPLLQSKLIRSLRCSCTMKSNKKAELKMDLSSDALVEKFEATILNNVTPPVKKADKLSIPKPKKIRPIASPVADSQKSIILPPAIDVAVKIAPIVIPKVVTHETVTAPKADARPAIVTPNAVECAPPPKLKRGRKKGGKNSQEARERFLLRKLNDPKMYPEDIILFEPVALTRKRTRRVTEENDSEKQMVKRKRKYSVELLRDDKLESVAELDAYDSVEEEMKDDSMSTNAVGQILVTFDANNLLFIAVHANDTAMSLFKLDAPSFSFTKLIGKRTSFDSVRELQVCIKQSIPKSIEMTLYQCSDVETAIDVLINIAPMTMCNPESGKSTAILTLCRPIILADAEQSNKLSESSHFETNEDEHIDAHLQMDNNENWDCFLFERPGDQSPAMLCDDFLSLGDFESEIDESNDMLVAFFS